MRVSLVVFASLLIGAVVYSFLAIHRSSERTNPLNYGTPFVQHYEFGASPGSPDTQKFTRGSDVFFSTIPLESNVKNRVLLQDATMNTGPCHAAMIEKLVAVPSAPPSFGRSTYAPFGYGSIHTNGWPLFRIRNYAILTGKYDFQFLVFAFSDPKNCAIHVDSVDIRYELDHRIGIERLVTGGVIFEPTQIPGLFDKDNANSAASDLTLLNTISPFVWAMRIAERDILFAIYPHA